MHPLHPLLSSWREEFSTAVVRGLAVVSALVVLSVFSSWVFQAPVLKTVVQPSPKSGWAEVEKPFPAFALTIPEAAGEPVSYAIRRHTLGGRKDILTLGAANGGSSFLQVEVYRPGEELAAFGDIANDILTRGGTSEAAQINTETAPLDSKFGSLTLANFVASKDTPRACVAFARHYDEPRLQLFGWFCQSGGDYVTRAMLSCALDRFSLLAAGSEPKVTALFAQAELHRTFCGQRSPLLAPTPQHLSLIHISEPTRPY